MENNTSLQQQLLEAGVHFGHLKKKWNPKMLPYIFAEKKGIHIIDLNKTVEGLQEAAAAMKSIAKSGKKIMFVATKKQAKEIVTEAAKRVNMPYVTERWLGGMLTNFNTVRKSVKKMQSIEKMLNDGSAESLTKLLPLYRTAVAAHKSFLFQGRAVFRVDFAKCAGNAQLDSFGLAFRSAAAYINHHVKRAFNAFQRFHWQLNLILQVHQREILLVLFAIYRDITCAFCNIYAGYSFLTAANGIFLFFHFIYNGFCF